MSPLELIVRGTAMYWLLFLIFRFVLRRDASGVGIADILFIVVVADAAQNGLAGKYETVAEGAVLVATLVAWNVLLDWAAFRFPTVRRFAQPRPTAASRCSRSSPVKRRRPRRAGRLAGAAESCGSTPRIAACPAPPSVNFSASRTLAKATGRRSAA
ncbi:MAG: hypothetical protein ABIX12_03585 [Rubrivivax sp.]